MCWGERNENRDHQWAESQRKHLEHRQFADPENCRRKRDQGILSSKRFESLLCWLLCLPGSEGALPLLEGKRTDLQDMQKADLLIFTSPNYCMMPSAPMKALLDLFFTNWMSHKPLEEMFSKRAVVISTAAGAGAKKAAKLIADNLTNWGIPKIDSYAAVVNAVNWDMVPPKKKAKIEKDMERLAKKLSRHRKVAAGIKTRILFWFYGGMQKANWGASAAEKEYWSENGWLSGRKPWEKQ